MEENTSEMAEERPRAKPTKTRRRFWEWVSFLALGAGFVAATHHDPRTGAVVAAVQGSIGVYLFGALVWIIVFGARKSLSLPSARQPPEPPPVLLASSVTTVIHSTLTTVREHASPAPDPSKPPPLRVRSHAHIDQAHFDAVAEELHQNRIELGLWERAYADTDGDEKLQRARYIEYRVEQLANHSTKELGMVFFESDNLDRNAGHAILGAINCGALPVNSVRILDGRRPIHVIAALGSVGGVKFLIAKGADVVPVDGAGLSALDYARRSGNPELVTYLHNLLQERALRAVFPDMAVCKRVSESLRGAHLSPADAQPILKACGWNVARTAGGWRVTNRDGQELRVTNETDLANFTRDVVRVALAPAAT